MHSDLRDRVDRVATRVPPLDYVLRVVDRYQALHGNVSANSITLTAFLALFAATLLAVAVIGYLDATNVDVAKQITEALGLRGDAASVVTNAVDTARRSARFATVIGFLGVVVVGTSLANAVATAYNLAWGVRNRGLIQRVKGLAWLAGIGMLLAASIVATSLSTRLPTALAPLLVAVAVLVNTLGWTFTSWWLPNRPIGLRVLLPGAIAGAVVLEALKVLGGIVVPHLIANASELWGTVGAVFALIAWILVFGRVVVFITVIEALEAERRGVKPRVGANLLP